MRVIWANTKQIAPQPIVPRHLLLGTPAYVGAIPQNLQQISLRGQNHQVFPALAVDRTVEPHVRVPDDSGDSIQE